VAEFIDGILEADRRAPRKQRHTAHRIWVRNHQRAAGGADCRGDGAAIYVRQRKIAMELRTSPEVYVPQQYAWGEEGQVDWYEAVDSGKAHKTRGNRLLHDPERPSSKYRLWLGRWHFGDLRCKCRASPRACAILDAS
jgi:hypothetical protein